MQNTQVNPALNAIRPNVVLQPFKRVELQPIALELQPGQSNSELPPQVTWRSQALDQIRQRATEAQSQDSDFDNGNTLCTGRHALKHLLTTILFMIVVLSLVAVSSTSLDMIRDAELDIKIVFSRELVRLIVHTIVLAVCFSGILTILTCANYCLNNVSLHLDLEISYSLQSNSNLVNSRRVKVYDHFLHHLSGICHLRPSYGYPLLER